MINQEDDLARRIIMYGLVSSDGLTADEVTEHFGNGRFGRDPSQWQSLVAAAHENTWQHSVMSVRTHGDVLILFENLLCDQIPSTEEEANDEHISQSALDKGWTKFLAETATPALCDVKFDAKSIKTADS